MIHDERGPLISTGILLGVGLGGFVDGIVLHQLLQWHSMVSSTQPPVDLVTVKLNMLWDGIFHVFTWLVTAAGIWKLWSIGRRPEVPWSPRVFVGSMVLGWGLFNLIEGIVDHHILGIHHVRPGPTQLSWDIAFLAFGLLQIVIGGRLIGAPRAERQHPAGAPARADPHAGGSR